MIFVCNRYDMYVCMYVCMYVYIYIYVPLHAYISIYIYAQMTHYLYIYVYICICICIFVYLYVYVCVFVYVYMYICIYIYLQIYIYIDIFTYMSSWTTAFITTAFIRPWCFVHIGGVGWGGACNNVHVNLRRKGHVITFMWTCGGRTCLSVATVYEFSGTFHSCVMPRYVSSL